ncbi:uncharacterized protein LOC144062652 [Vanacampus margaritifer]
MEHSDPETWCRRPEDGTQDTKWDAEAQSLHHHHKQNDHQLPARGKALPFVQQVWTSKVKQELPEPPNIKEEEEQLQGLEEADITHSSAHVKRERGPTPLRLHHGEGDIKIKAEPVSSVQTTKADENLSSRFELDNHLGPLRHAHEYVKSESFESDDTEEPLKNKKLKECGTTPQFACHVCRQKFQLWKYLRAHIATHVKTHTKPTGEKTYSCSFCGKIYSKRSAVTVHVKMHATEKEFSCSECGKRFTRNQQLTKHMKVHTGEKTFPCSVCGKTFAYKGNLSVHMRIHTGEKPFSCSVCGSQYSTKANMKSHMLTHTGEKAFSCSVCAESFARSDNLQKHMRTHTGERPFACLACDLKFVQKEHLVAHVRTHSSEKTLSCGVCNQRFSRKQQADKHKCNVRQPVANKAWN